MPPSTPQPTCGCPHACRMPRRMQTRRHDARGWSLSRSPASSLPQAWRAQASYGSFVWLMAARRIRGRGECAGLTWRRQQSLDRPESVWKQELGKHCCKLFDRHPSVAEPPENALAQHA